MRIRSYAGRSARIPADPTTLSPHHILRSSQPHFLRYVYWTWLPEFRFSNLELEYSNAGCNTFKVLWLCFSAGVMLMYRTAEEGSAEGATSEKPTVPDGPRSVETG